MARSDDQHLTTGNSFIDSLRKTTRARLVPLLEKRRVKRAHVIARPDEPFSEVVFPVRSVISTVTVTVEGSSVEVGLAGHEGLSPLPIAFGSAVSQHETVVQIPDSALFIKANAFLDEFRALADLRERCGRYAEYSFGAATQFAACNAIKSGRGTLRTLDPHGQ